MTESTDKSQPKAARKVSRQKIADFARYEGTSAWKKYRSKVRAYAWYLAAKKKAAAAA